MMHHASEIQLLKCTLNSETEQLGQLPISHSEVVLIFMKYFKMTVKFSNI